MAQRHDIEDVLTSVRRLVAAAESGARHEDLSAIAADLVDGEAGPAEPSSDGAAEAAALVLTPSHRVTEPEDPFQMIQALADADRDETDARHFVLDEAEDAAPDIAQLRPAAADLSPVQADAPARDAWQSEPTLLQAVPTAASPAVRAASRWSAELLADYAEDADYQAKARTEPPIPAPQVNGSDASPEAAPPRFETARAAPVPAAAEAEIAAGDPSDDVIVLPDGPAAEPSDDAVTDDPGDRSAEPPAVDDASAAPDGDAPTAEEVEADPAELLSAILASEQEDGPPADREADMTTASPLGDGVAPIPFPPRGRRATAQDAADVGEDEMLANLSMALESDEALRDLIAEIVRQELAGALGERITRNVRRLVRRELRQMMSTEEFD